MTAKRNLVAIDLGAESGRIFLCQWSGEQGGLREIHRFRNGPRKEGGYLVWDTECLWNEVLKGLALAAREAGGRIDSIGIDGWAVDYVLLDRSGNQLGKTFCYRDPRRSAQMQRAFSVVPKQRIYEVTGIQFLPFNTLYQLLAHIDEFPEEWEKAACWLNLPEYFLYRLSGVMTAEYTNATHTQLVDVFSRQWSVEIAEAFGLSLEKFPPITEPGTVLGNLRSEIAQELKLADAKIIAPACHDTASAVAGIPFSHERSAFVSSGTWSLVGTVLPQPVLSDETLKLNFTNEGGICHTIRFLKNVIGLWLLQQCLEEWNALGQPTTAARLVEECSEVSPEGPFFVADSETFLAPGDMVARINAALRSQGFPEESRPLELAKIIFRSLARRYAQVIDEIRRTTGKSLKCICIVGGGVKNEALNTLTHHHTGLEIMKGSNESAATGNAAVQIAALERMHSLDEVRAIAANLAPNERG